MVSIAPSFHSQSCFGAENRAVTLALLLGHSGKMQIRAPHVAADSPSPSPPSPLCNSRGQRGVMLTFSRTQPARTCKMGGRGSSTYHLLVKYEKRPGRGFSRGNAADAVSSAAGRFAREGTSGRYPDRESAEFHAAPFFQPDDASIKKEAGFFKVAAERDAAEERAAEEARMFDSLRSELHV